MKNLNRQLVSARGFTLIEILIVILIISIISGMALLTVNHNRNTQLLTTAKQLTHWLKLCQTTAILKPLTLKFSMSNNTTTVETLKTDAAKDHWELANQIVPNHYHWPADIKLKQLSEAAIVFQPSGDVTPFIITIAWQHDKPLLKVQGDNDGNIFYKYLGDYAE